uniref:NADH-ubiquinone oxidoreductase chain 3 n=1 Tax=Aneurus sublobatus TaxID=1176473 RepID=A0A172DYT3_9HEMI|nr:NADH dehydrogenase subunit 3 [Aneurus sublobatus]AFI54687.1 NADH dehydrogenase subunit 3 [Aneurus sublobatus]
MMICIIAWSATLMISAILLTMSVLISIKSEGDREKLSPFECGFDPIKSPRTPFSIQFFLVAMLFLVFDVEIAIIMPSIPTLKDSDMMMWTVTMTFFILILIVGLYYEWNKGALQWTN